MKAIKTIALIALAVVSFIFLAGEPASEMSLAKFFLIKGLALAGFVLALVLSIDKTRVAIDNKMENKIDNE